MRPTPSLQGPVVVWGASGCLGRAVVTELRARGCSVRTPTSRQMNALRAGEKDWAPWLHGALASINTVGVLRGSDADLEKIHHTAAQTWSKACADHAVRAVHVSGFGLGNSTTHWGQTKWRGEQAVRHSHPGAVVVRLGLLDTPTGYGGKWLRIVASWPIHPIPTDATGQVATASLDDAAIALATAALHPSPSPILNVWDAVHPTIQSYLAHLGSHSRALPIPGWLSSGVARLCDRCGITPWSVGHHDLLRRNYTPHPADVQNQHFT